MPLVSIIVPIYNVEKYIDSCIKSIINQTYKNLEILLVDDGTKDRSGDICEKYSENDKRICVIHKENGGLSDARNCGITKATGKYLLFVDGDDYIALDCVEKAVACAEKHEADIVVFDYQEIEEITGRVDKRFMQLPKEEVINTETNPTLLLTSPCAWNKLYRRELWERTQMRYPLQRYYEDLTVTPQLMVNAKRVVYLESEPLYNYILREGSIMRSRKFEKNYEDRKLAINDVIAYFREKKLFDKYYKELEFLTFEHIFFFPTKEVLYYAPESPYLKLFGTYAFELFPKAYENPYVKEVLSSKDKLILWLVQRKMYGAVRMLSMLRKKVDLIRKK